MVEATATDPTAGVEARAYALRIAPSRGVDVAAASGAEAFAVYAQAIDGGVHAPPQGARWTQHWRDCVNGDLVAGVLTRDGRPIFALALEIVRQGPFRVARFPGGSHANGNFAPTCRSAPPLRVDIERLIEAISRARPDIDLILLERMAPELHGLDNPLLALPHSASADLGLAVNLDGGFEGVMSRASGKRKRKKHRSQQRKFEATGAIDVRAARDADEVGNLLDIFFTIKGERLKRLGVDDVFADQAVRRFFKRLFGDAAASGAGDFVLERMCVGGKVRAITGSSMTGDRTICEFSAIANDDLTFASPGEYLFFEAIAAACREGRSVYDFSVGDEGYKRLWCDIETIYADVRIPLGFKGAALSAGIATRAALVRAVKASRLWPLLKKLRRREIEYAKPEDAD